MYICTLASELDKGKLTGLYFWMTLAGFVSNWRVIASHVVIDMTFSVQISVTFGVHLALTFGFTSCCDVWCESCYDV